MLYSMAYRQTMAELFHLSAFQHIEHAHQYFPRRSSCPIQDSHEIVKIVIQL